MIFQERCGFFENYNLCTKNSECVLLKQVDNILIFCLWCSPCNFGISWV